MKCLEGEESGNCDKIKHKKMPERVMYDRRFITT